MNENHVVYVRTGTTNIEQSRMLQINRCTALAAARGHNISCIYADIGAGSHDNGEALQRLLLDCAADRVTTLYVSSRDRIARNFQQYMRITATMREHGVPVVYLEDAIGMTAERI